MPDSLIAHLQASFSESHDVESELGGGGMSRVFLARDRSLGRMVVIKVLPPEASAEVSAARFRREIQVAASLQHPLIVPLLSAGDASGLVYFTMPFVEGEPLRARMQRGGQMPVSEVIAVLRDVLSALAYAHARGIVHRDIKPENILLSGGHALVADFGVARALAGSGRADATAITSIGMALGTPAYMAPEQAAADPAMDHRVDLYAVGVLAWEMLAGTHPFAGRSPQSVVAAHLSETPEVLSRRRPDAGRALSTFVAKLLSKDPAERPATAADAARELESAASGEIGIAGVSRRRTRSLVAAGALLLVALASWAVIASSGERARGSAQGVATIARASSVGVMPFENMGGTDDDEHFSDGLTEELIGALGRVPQLRVAARTSVFAIKGAGLGLRQVGDTLGVATVLTGSVRRAGERLRVAVRLEDVATGQILWSETFDRDRGDVFAVQDEIARTVAARLAASIDVAGGPRLVTGATSDLEAHDLALRARFAIRRRQGNHADDLRRAVALFDQSLARDPAYAGAAAGLAEAYTLQAIYGYMTPHEGYALARTAAERAVALDSTLGEAHTARGFILATQREYESSERAFRRAIELRPSDAWARHYYSLLLTIQGRYDVATVENGIALQLDPLSLPANVTRASLALAAGDHVGSRAALSRTLALDSTFPLGIYIRGVLDVAEDNPRAAIEPLRKLLRDAPGFPGIGAVLATAYSRLGDRDAAENEIAELRRRSADRRGAFNLALALAARNDVDEAFRLLRRSELDVPEMIDLRSNPLIAPVRLDPRYAAFLGELGLRP